VWIFVSWADWTHRMAESDWTTGSHAAPSNFWMTQLGS
jgi:hypothetical protein